MRISKGVPTWFLGCVLVILVTVLTRIAIDARRVPIDKLDRLPFAHNAATSPWDAARRRAARLNPPEIVRQHQPKKMHTEHDYEYDRIAERDADAERKAEK